MRKTSGYQSKKFNVGKLKEQDVKILYARKTKECLTGFNDSESINEDWKALRVIITTTADALLGKAGKIEQNNGLIQSVNKRLQLKMRHIERYSRKIIHARQLKSTIWHGEKRKEYIRERKRITMSLNLQNLNTSEI
jgi:hypothetical protein